MIGLAIERAPRELPVPSPTRSEAMLMALRLAAPGTALRAGIERIIQARMGALLVIGAGIRDANAARDAGVDVTPADRNVTTLAEDSEQHREARRIDPLRDASRPWRPVDGCADERLHFDEQRSRAVHDGDDDGSRGAGGPVGEKQRRRIRHVDQSVRGHLENAQLLSGTKPVLERAKETQRVVAITLEREDGVDDVLE